MNRTKTIYFLSAIVLIIGCYALNLSYSLFVQTENRDIVNLTVPSLAYSLETSTYTIPANSGELIKLKVINSGTADINYGISTTQVDGLTVQLVDKDDNNIIGTLAAAETVGESSTKEVWLYGTNNNETDTEITFNITAKYTTLNFDVNFALTSNIDVENLYKLNKLRFLNETLIASAQDAVTNNDATRTLYNDTFVFENILEESKNERMLALTEDDYGTSYYYRGEVIDNYVNFAGMCWRIVRIEGDGSTKIILEDMYAECNSEQFIGNWSDNYLYPFDIYFDSYYETDNPDFINGGLADSFEAFQEVLLEELSKIYGNQNLSDKLKKEEWCNDNEITSTSNWGYDENYEYTEIEQDAVNGWFTDQLYGTLTRIYNGEPTLKCNGTKVTKFSNNDDMYVGTLTYEEVLAAVGMVSSSNYNLYLSNDYAKDNNLSWWVLSPGLIDGEFGRGLGFVIDPGSASVYYRLDVPESSVRPVITLNSNVIIEPDGDGTKSNPYVVINVDNNSSDAETPEENT